MMRALAGFAFAALLSAADKPSFDLADVHVSPRADWSKAKRLQGGYLAGDRFELHRATLVDLIHLAYGVDPEKVFGGPSWLDYDRYEVVAKTKPGTRPETLNLMLQSLLEDRFKVAVKTGSREVLGYVLSKGKGELKARQAAETSPPGTCTGVQPRIDGDTMYAITRCSAVTMAGFAEAMRPRLSATPIQGLPVVDSTGLEGRWDLDFEIAVKRGTPANNQAERLIEAIRGLGLNVELTKVPQPVFVVGNANEQPTPNSPDVEKNLPPRPPPAFEVAAVKWPCGDERVTGPIFGAGGRVTLICTPLLTLIRDSWGVPPYVSPVGMPKWLADGTSNKYNISIFAKAPANVAPDPQHSNEARDLLNQMVRQLLIERYRMKVHEEDRPMDAQSLVAVKPKLTRADPAGRTGCTRESQQQQGRALLVKLVCRNITLAQFAEQLQGIEFDIQYPVLDATGIQGAWDFTLNYDAMASLNARFLPLLARAAVSTADASAAEPAGSLSLVDAIEKQLGLKLELRKRPMPVLVIDHMEEKPIEN